MLKKIYLLFIGIAIVLVSSCQSKDDVGKLQEIKFGINLPEDIITRTALFGPESNSIKGGITNVDLKNKYDIRYQLAIYEYDEATGNYVLRVTPKMIITDTYMPISYSFHLAIHKKYKVVGWADFVLQGTTADLHYNTSNFEKITCIDAPTAQLNDESRDAYFVAKDFSIDEASISETLVMKRPFAKLRIVSTDWTDPSITQPDNFKVTYYGCKRFVDINLMTGESTGENIDSSNPVEYQGNHINKSEKEYAYNYDMSEGNRTLVVDYLMTDKRNEFPIHLRFDAYDGQNLVKSQNLSTNIPVKRNWITSIVGRVLTAEGAGTVVVDHHS